VSQKQILRQLGIILGGLLFFYVASIGPVAAWVESRGYENRVEGERLRMIYLPIIAVCFWCKPVSECVGAYINYCVKLSGVKQKQDL